MAKVPTWDMPAAGCEPAFPGARLASPRGIIHLLFNAALPFSLLFSLWLSKLGAGTCQDLEFKQISFSFHEIQLSVGACLAASDQWRSDFAKWFI